MARNAIREVTGIGDRVDVLAARTMDPLVANTVPPEKVFPTLSWTLGEILRIDFMGGPQSVWNQALVKLIVTRLQTQVSDNRSETDNVDWGVYVRAILDGYFSMWVYSQAQTILGRGLETRKEVLVRVGDGIEGWDAVAKKRASVGLVSVAVLF